MIYVITGEDIVTSRKKLTELLEDKQNIIRLEGTKATIAELDEALSSGSLFADSKTIVLENFTKLKPEATVLKLLEKFEKEKNTDIILWDEAEMSAKIKNAIKSAKIFSFSFPKFYYQFLDGLSPGTKGSVIFLHEVLKIFEPEQVLYGLTKRVRQLLMVKLGSEKDFAELRRMQSWQIGKLKKQASLWREDELKKVFLELAELDEKMKTSNLSMPLSKHLDILLLSDLN